MTFNIVLSLIIFGMVYVIISTEFFNKTIAVLLGAVLVVFFGLVNQEKIYEVIDWNVIFLLIGMMLIVGITKKSGIFQYVAIKAAKLVKGDPVKIMVLLFVITGIFSAFLDNVTTVLIITPITILIAVELGISPIPFVISEAVASNIGGAATLIGDPPNIMIGSAANLSFNEFLLNLTPLILIMMVVTIGVLILIYKKHMVVTEEKRARIMDFDEKRAITNYPLLIKSLIVLSLVILGFVFHDAVHLEASIIALGGASLLMLISSFPKNDENEHISEEAFKEVEWGTIFFFLGLFILVNSLVELGIIKMLADSMMKVTHGDLFLTSNVILWMSGIFSAFVDNIPYVATMIPLIQEMGKSLTDHHMEVFWWVLSIGSCIGGNGTLIGASANVVSCGIAKKSGYNISFIEFTKIGGLTTIINLIIGSIYFYFRYFFIK